MAKRDFLGGYKTYDPKSEGFGDTKNWRDAFNQRLGNDELPTDKTPRSVLGVSLSATWNEIRSAHRKLAAEFYPEVRNGQSVGDKVKFLAVQKAYEHLRQEFGR